MTRAWWVAALLVAAGCVRGPTCAEDGCPAETVCQLDGTCRPLTVTAMRARDRHLRAADFGGTRRDRRAEAAADLDELVLGGSLDGSVFLAFDLPEGEVREAVLVLFPAEGASGGDRQTLRLSRVRAFEGPTLTHRNRPVVSKIGPGRTLAAVPDRPLRVDVTELLDDGDSGERVHLMASGDGDGVPWRIASPVALDPERAPRLELRLAR